MRELLRYATESIKNNPHIADEIRGLLTLCYDEIDEGGSEAHEIELCAEDIRQLIEQNN